MRAWIAARMRAWADELDRDGAPKVTSWTFTFERGEGVRFREDGRGCPIAYLGERDYARAHDEADTADPEPEAPWPVRCPKHPDAEIGYTDPTGGDPFMGGPVLIAVCRRCGRQVSPP